MDYDYDPSVTQTFKDVLELPEFDKIRASDISIKAIVQIKMTKEGEEEESSGELVAIKKVPPIFEFISELQFVLVACKFRWHNIDDTARQALVHKALMTIDLDDEGKIKRRSPDINEFSETISRFGPYSENLRDFRRTLNEEVGTSSRKVTATVSVNGVEVGEMEVSDD